MDLDGALAARLRREVRGEVLLAPGDRARYATDASIYQMQPLAVVVPQDVADVQAVLALAREGGVPVLPRGGGTSQCGQTVNRAIVLDCSVHMRKILHVDAAAQTALVEPGLVLSHLNAALKRDKLFFPVDPSTQSRCTIGGMAGNNSCGSKSIRYGLMADNVLAIDAILPDGTASRFGAFPEAGDNSVGETVSALLGKLRALGVAEADEIAARFPRQLRRVGGYNIDVLTPAALRDGRANLARLLVGSEGTLAFSAALELKLSPLLPRKMVGICQFPSFRGAMQAAKHIVTLNPEAVELVDRTMIELGRGIPIFRRIIDRMVKGEPDSLLLVEFHGHADAPLLAKLDELDTMMADLGHPGAVVRATDAAFQAQIAQVREAGLNIMMSMKGEGKPVSFIEDCAVDLDDLADYTEKLDAVFTRHGTKGTWYAHASVGCLHVRPVLNMKNPADISTMRAVAEECFALVRAYKGSHSGEHGDGILRSEFHAQMFGQRIVHAFEAVKEAFDPAATLNPGRIVHAPRMDDRSLFRYGPGYAADAAITPVLDWSDHPQAATGGPLAGLLAAVEMCNNNGTCRSFDAGSMCPSYRVTRKEAHVTRGRANILRHALTGQAGLQGLADDAVTEAMALCVSCKACRRECPTGVDMAKMKIEVLAARASQHGVGLRARLVAELPRYAGTAAALAPLANLRNHLPPLARLGERALGLSASRRLPAFRRDRFRDTEAPEGGDVLLLADSFNRYFEPENLRAAMRVLRAAGFNPSIARPADGATRPLCCGRTYLSAGMVDKARAEARRMLAALAGNRPVIGLEPSCLLTLRDEFLSLLPGTEARQLSGRAKLLGEFLEERGGKLKLRAVPNVAHVHGHCHQKAFAAFDPTLAVLGRVPELRVQPITSACCGMAGPFGYQAETQDASRAMAEASLLPAVREAGAEALIVADGTSCRHQINDLAGRRAVHSVTVLDAALA